MDWKVEGSAKKTDSRVLQEQEVILEDTGEESISESFQLLQIDVECEHREGETLPTGGAVWSSKNVQRKQRHWEKIVAAKKSKRKQEKERRKANRVENSGICPQHSKRFLRSLTKERLLEAKHSGPRLCIDLSMTHHMSKKELSRLAGQIRRLYGSNKKADRPFWISLTGFTTDSPLYEECLRMNDGFSSYLKVTFQKAREHSVKTARLPIQEYMVRCQNGKNYHSEILAINQEAFFIFFSDSSYVKDRGNFSLGLKCPVFNPSLNVFDILATYFETQNWPESLKKGVSSRKGYILQNSVDDGQPKELQKAKVLEVP
ncbi:tRNA methyltransferase 10 homolog B isoform X4 [Ailuropoda melanoleuca]|uniref:tRNA methyltransferase 10 homolog B isoform X4 n=1 Tax=Ailuropoda melanoleuca TaxID=9646 RepID=UPI000947C059|nr:tRNA methyltransferase 10 homolog B isoform X4 [Ailuropoda melanoleuca]